METILTKFNKISFFCNDESGENDFPILWIRNCIKWGSRSTEGDMLTLLVYAQVSADSPYMHIPVFCSRRTKDSVYVSDNGWILGCFEENDRKRILALLNEEEKRTFNNNGIFGVYTKSGMSNCLLIDQMVYLVTKIDSFAEQLNIHMASRKKPLDIVSEAVDETYFAETLFRNLKDCFVFVDENDEIISEFINEKKSFLITKKEEYAYQMLTDLIAKGVKCHIRKIENIDSLIYSCFIHNKFEQMIVVSYSNNEYLPREVFLGWDAKYLVDKIAASF